MRGALPLLRDRAVNAVRRTPKRHGMSRTPEYRAWRSMLNRCGNPNTENYPRYGGRGITICARWLASFDAFFSDMGPRPSAKHSLDRYPNNDGNYEPGNVRWATSKEQQANISSNVWLDAHGERKLLKHWCRELGISERLVRRRMRDGLAMDEVLSPPAMTDNRRVVIEFRGETLTLKDWSLRTGLTTGCIWTRLSKGWSAERALTTPWTPKGERRWASREKAVHP